MSKANTPKIRHVAWREGRPRFQPGSGLREQGFKGKDLRHDDGRWFSQGEALDWSNAFCLSLAQDEVKRGPAVKSVARKPEGSASNAPIQAAAAVRRAVYPLSRLFEDWLQSPRVQAKAPATIKDYRQKSRVIETHDPDLWACEVAALDRPICYGLYEELWKERGLATARGVLTVMGIAIKWGLNSGKIRGLVFNPARDLDMQQPPPRARFLTKSEFLALVDAAERLGRPDMADVFYTGVWTAQRQADRLALKLSAIRNGRFVVRQQKTGAIVNAPVAPELKKRWDQAAERRRSKDLKSVFVHLNEAMWAPWNHYTYRNLFAEIRTEAAKQVPTVATVQEKDFRSTGVTWMAMSGLTLPEICAVSGHSLQGATLILRHYLALHPEMATTAIGKLVEWYEAGGNAELAV
ncbi:tyrosine-type recombinase/integrase [Rhizobium sp. CAU 1783]